jgi:hypothetical protein
LLLVARLDAVAGDSPLLAYPVDITVQGHFRRLIRGRRFEDTVPTRRRKPLRIGVSG